MRAMAARHDYVETFDARGASYNEAAAMAPRARDAERATLIELLRVEPDHLVCDVPSGGGYLAEGLRPRVRDARQILCVEPSAVFAACIDPAHATHVGPVDAWPVGDASLDRVASLAGLHHLEAKAPLLAEAARALRPGGRIAVGDVLDGTAPARFLDGPVDRFTATGHRGRFVRAGELTTMLRAAGFVDVDERHRRCDWRFASTCAMVAFCRALFGLVHASAAEVSAALHGAFDIRAAPSGVRLPWSLTFAVGRRP